MAIFVSPLPPQIRNEYVAIMSRIYAAHFRTYLSAMERMHAVVATQADTLGGGDSAGGGPTNVLSLFRKDAGTRPTTVRNASAATHQQQCTSNCDVYQLHGVAVPRSHIVIVQAEPVSRLVWCADTVWACTCVVCGTGSCV